MAIIKFNQIAVASGSVNGTTYSRNYIGAYMRNRTVPVNQNTVNQITARNALTDGAVNWKNLSEPQREDWRIYAAGTPVVNKVGDTVHLKGNNWFAASAAFRNFLSPGSGSGVLAPPSPGLAIPISYQGDPVIDVSTDDITLDLLTPGTGVDQIAVWISNPQSAGVAYFNGPWNYVGFEASPTLPAVNVGSVPIPLVAGNRHFLRVRYITSTNRLSPEYVSGPWVVQA